MPLYIEKSPIVLVGIGVPMFITNLMAHKVVDDDTSRIMLLSTVGAELNTLQHFGHNSRKILIKGRINLNQSDRTLNRFNPLFGTGVETLLTGLRLLKETKSAVLLIMNHSICYGVISKIVITDDREYPTVFDYDLEIIEKDIYGLKISAISQRIFSGLLANTFNSFDKRTFIEPDRIIPKLIEDEEDDE